MSKTEIVPFGKYKGHPIEVLAQDKEYLDWLLAQEWFRSGYQSIYAIVINSFQTPSETPEHNILQAKFLDADYRFKVAYFLSAGKYRDNLDYETDLDPEVDGFDILIHTYYYGLEKEINIYVEAKPTVGDDYPAIMRQMRNSSAYKKWEKGDFGIGEDKIQGMKFCLLVGEYHGVVKTEDFIKFFGAASIHVVFAEMIDQYNITYSENQGKWIEVLTEKTPLFQRIKKDDQKQKENTVKAPTQLSLFELNG